MAQRNIDFGTFPDDPDADAIRTAFQKTQENFTELFNGLQDQAVFSVNRTAGAGISVNNPTGNVVVSANIACVQVQTSTLGIGIGSNTANYAVYTSSGQTLNIDLPGTINNVANINLSNTLVANTVNVNLALNGNVGNFSGNLTALNGNLGNTVTANFFIGSGNNLSNIQAANITGTVANATHASTANTIVDNSQPNITSVGTLTSLAVTGNISAGNVNAGNLLTANFVTGTLTTNAQPNVTSLGTLSSLTVTGNISAGNINGGNLVTANFLSGDGYLISNVNALANSLITNGNSNVTIPSIDGNVEVNIDGNNIALFTASGANINGIANVTGNLIAANVSANVGSFTTLVGEGGNISNIQGANVSGAVSFASTANSVAGANVSGAVSFATTANSVAGANVSGEVSFAATANSVAGANVSGAVSFATTANSVAGANVSGTVANATYAIDSNTANFAGTVTTNAQPNITSVGTLSSLVVTGNVSAGNINAGNLLTANFISGTLVTNSQPNITSVGNLTSLDVTGNISAGNINGGNLITANFLSGDGGLISNLTVSAGTEILNGNSNVSVSANSNVNISVSGNANVVVVTGTGANVNGSLDVTGNINGNLVGNILTASQPNITSLGNLTGLNVQGISNLGPNSNVIITGGANNAFLKTDGSGNLIWDTATLIPAQGSNTQVIFNDGGATYAGNAGFTFNKSTGALAVPGSITSINANLGNTVTANFFIGSGANLANITGANVTGTVANATHAITANTVTTAAQPNITSVGTLTSLAVTGNITAGNVSGGNLVSANFLTGTLTTANQPNITNVGTLGLLIVSGNINAGNISGGNLVGASFLAGTLTTGSQPNITAIGTLSGLNVNGNITAANITANTGVFTGNGSGLTNLAGANVTGTVANATFATSAGSSNTAGTVTTNAQPNITSVGTLSVLLVSGNINAGNISGGNLVSANFFAGNASNLFSIPGANVTGTVANATYAANAGNATTATTAGTVTTAAQPNITSVGTLSSLSVTGNANVGNIGATNGVFTNISGNGSALTGLNASNISTGTLAQARLANASLTLGNTTLTLGSTVTSVTGLTGVTATTFTGSLSGAATTAGTVTTAAQPNITSVGTLTSLTSSGNISAANVSVSGYHIRSVGTGISAAGTVQANATAITKEINVVSTVSSGAGVRLPTAVAGMVINITNTTANALLVYPASGAAINSLAANAGFSHAAGATLQFIAPTTTQWYTVGATYA